MDEGATDADGGGSSVDMAAIVGFRDTEVVAMIRERVLEAAMTAGVYAQLKPLLGSDDMAPAKVATCSAACGAVAAWLQAVLSFANAAKTAGMPEATIQGWRDLGAKGMQESERVAAAQKALQAKAEATVGGATLGGAREAWSEGGSEGSVAEASVKLTLSVTRTEQVTLQPTTDSSARRDCQPKSSSPPHLPSRAYRGDRRARSAGRSCSRLSRRLCTPRALGGRS